MEIKMKTEFIKLDSFLKWAGAVSQGSEAKAYILNGEVNVNGEVELRRGKKIYPGDKVEFNGETYLAVAE
ncbi:MAG: S4 domain-containing protein YaaA [Clostridium sp.]|nr:S4 domain-containing protein YaaA [Clostridium sp.]